RSPTSNRGGWGGAPSSLHAANRRGRRRREGANRGASLRHATTTTRLDRFGGAILRTECGAAGWGRPLLLATRAVRMIVGRPAARRVRLSVGRPGAGSARRVDGRLARAVATPAGVGRAMVVDVRSWVRRRARPNAGTRDAIVTRHERQDRGGRTHAPFRAVTGA